MRNLSGVFSIVALVLSLVITTAAVSIVAGASEIAIGPAEPTEIAPSRAGVVRATEPDEDSSHAPSVSWESVAANMQSARTLLAAGDAGEATQLRQREIVAGLDAMIAAARSASRRQTPRSPTERNPAENSGGNSTGTDGDAANPNAQESVERHGSERAEDPDDAGPRRTAAEEFWGRLPERVRQRVLQSAEMRAVPKYSDAVEEYFQRLLESQDSTNSLRQE